MTVVYADDIDIDLSDIVRCDRCGAPPGVPCTTRSGNVAREPHMGRVMTFSPTAGR